MTVRPSVSALLAALVLGPAATFAAACGEEERTGLLSSTRAAQIRDGLADVQEAVEDGSCTRVREELSGLRTQLDQLPQSTDPELRDRLEEGVSHLEEIAPVECEDRTTDTQTETEPETIPEVPTETQPVEPPVTEPPVTTTPVPRPGGEDGEGGAGDEQTPGNGTGPPGGTPPGQVPDSGGTEAPGSG